MERNRNSIANNIGYSTKTNDLGDKLNHDTEFLNTETKKLTSEGYTIQLAK